MIDTKDILDIDNWEHIEYDPYINGFLSTIKGYEVLIDDVMMKGGYYLFVDGNSLVADIDYSALYSRIRDKHMVQYKASIG